MLARELTAGLASRAGGRCLEIAPLNPFVFGGWLRGQGWAYEAMDTRRLRERSDPGGFDTFIDHDADITDMRFAPADHYELVLLQHVLEEIPDYRAALDEISRVLKPAGRAILEIPLGGARVTQHKDADRYGNRWAFGEELVFDLEARFAAVSLRELAEPPYRGQFFVCEGR